MWARLPDPDETESGVFSFLFVVVAAPISVLCKILRCLEGLLGGIGVLCRILKGLKGLVGGIGVLCKILRCLEGLFLRHWRFV